MAREFAAAFYKSGAWTHCRETYMKSVGYLCEMCKERGRLTPGDTVHHKIHLNPNNISDPTITLGWDNLMCLCRDCHAEIHKGKPVRRYAVDKMGRVLTGQAPL